MSYPTKGRADYLDLGDWNAVCSMCGRKRKASTMEKNWQGMYRCPEHNEPRQPQDFVRGIPDIQTPPWVQPPADEFVDMEQASDVTVSDSNPSIGDTITITVDVGGAVSQATVVAVVASNSGVVEPSAGGSMPLLITIPAGQTSATGSLRVVGSGGTVLSFSLNGVTQTVTLGVAAPEPSADLLVQVENYLWRGVSWEGLEVDGFSTAAQVWKDALYWDISNNTLLIGSPGGDDLIYGVSDIMTTVYGPTTVTDVQQVCRYKNGATMQFWGGPAPQVGIALDGLPYQVYSPTLSVLSSGTLSADPSYTWGTSPAAFRYAAVGGVAYGDTNSDCFAGVPGCFAIDQATGSVSFVTYASGRDTYAVACAVVAAPVGAVPCLFRPVDVAGAACVEVTNALTGALVQTLTVLPAGAGYVWQGLATDENQLLTVLRDNADPFVVLALLWSTTTWTGVNVSAGYNNLGWTITGATSFAPLGLTF